MKSNLIKLIAYLESHQVPNWRSEVDHPHSILPDVFPEKFKLLSDGSLAYANDVEPLFLDDLHGFFGLSKQDYSDLFIYCEAEEPNGGWHYPNQFEWIAQAKALV